jgi:hypothetical protein
MHEFMEDKGSGNKLSATRLALLLWSVGVVGIWGFVSWRTNTLQTIPESVVTIFGLLLGGKAVQRFGER